MQLASPVARCILPTRSPIAPNPRVRVRRHGGAACSEFCSANLASTFKKRRADLGIQTKVRHTWLESNDRILRRASARTFSKPHRIAMARSVCRMKRPVWLATSWGICFQGTQANPGRRGLTPLMCSHALNTLRCADGRHHSQLEELFKNTFVDMDERFLASCVTISAVR